jgi:F-type H+-transporting ATPase subunit delta
MRGASRASYAALREKLSEVAVGPATSEQIGEQLFAVVRLLDSEHGLRRALADIGKPAAEKSDVAHRLLHGRVSEATEGLVADAVAAHWASASDLADALEQLAIEAHTAAAQYGGTLDDMEDDLFRFGRVVSGETGLRAALTGPTTSDAKGSLLTDLLSAKVSGPSLNLITEVLTHPRGRSPQGVLDLAAGIAARRREELLAVVRVAVELSATLTATYGQGIHLNVVLDPTVVGGMSVQIGDELIDGTAVSRLAEVRRRLAG